MKKLDKPVKKRISQPQKWATCNFKIAALTNFKNKFASRNLISSAWYKGIRTSEIVSESQVA